MNLAQKNAWFGLINCLLAITFFCFFFYRAIYYVPVSGFRLSPQPSQWEVIVKTFLQVWPVVLFLLPAIALTLLFIPRKKQSIAEPNFDELDEAIQNKAVRISFISVWLLWPLALTLIMLKVSNAGILSISIIEGFFIHFGVFLICMAIYFFTMIVLYRIQTKGTANE